MFKEIYNAWIKVRNEIKRAKEDKRIRAKLLRNDIDYDLLQKIVNTSDKKIIISLANGTTLTIEKERNNSKPKTFKERFTDKWNDNYV